MIGRFVYMNGAPGGHIVLDLSWRDGAPEARVSSPDHVVELFRRQDMSVRYDDEAMSLPIALGYAVLLAGLSETDLVVSGDRSAWPSEWGELVDMHPMAVNRARAH